MAPNGLAPLEPEIEWDNIVRYTGHNTHIAHKLMLDWNGWVSEGTSYPSATNEIIGQTASAWIADGFKLNESRVHDNTAQLLFSVTPDVSPVLFSTRVKGRLQHAMRLAGEDVKFSRKVSVRCLGENTRGDVESYLSTQVPRGDFADERFRKRMEKYTVVKEDVNLAEPLASVRGRYWYNLHIVLVVAGRVRFADDALLSRLRDESFVIGDGNGYGVKSVSIMPDHVHIAVRGNIEHSPKEIGLAFQNHLAGVVGCKAWQDGFYVGTFSEYEAGIIRRLNS
jgi:REP element-mobilizing transposase RayT